MRKWARFGLHVVLVVSMVVEIARRMGWVGHGRSEVAASPSGESEQVSDIPVGAREIFSEPRAVDGSKAHTEGLA